MNTELTTLSEGDLRIIHEVTTQLPLWANVSQADIFIDCLLPDGDAAIVVAEAHPETGKSLYRLPVTGEVALMEKEPGVLHCLRTGEAVMGSRGVSQENVNIQQNVTPIKNKQGQTIAALIMERDITEIVEKEKHVEVLMETTEQLGETLFQQAMTEHKLPALINEGLIIFNSSGYITFANHQAKEILTSLGQNIKLTQTNVNRLCFGRFAMEQLEQHGGVLSEDFEQGTLFIRIKAVCIHRDDQMVGGILLLQDLTEIKQKDREIRLKSAVIKEIHHRVKNNLQTIASLLRLQMRRSESKEVEKVFRESINRIMSISIIHEVLSQDGLDNVDCKEIFECITNGIVSSMRKHDQWISVKVEGDSLFLHSRNASSLALIINELVQNALNHAFQKPMGTLSILLKKHGNRVEVSVSDDGVGFNYNPKRGGNLGLEICHTLVQEDLDGTIEFINTGHGTRVLIQFPLLEEEGERDDL